MNKKDFLLGGTFVLAAILLTFSVSVFANDNSLSSCLDLAECTEGGVCNVTEDCMLNSGLCAGSLCQFTLFTSNSTVMTGLDGSGNANNLAINITSESTRSQLNLVNATIDFSGASGAQGGNGGILNITVPDLFNTTSMFLNGSGGYSTASGNAGGNGGIAQFNYHGLIRNFTLRTVAPIMNGGDSVDSGSGDGGTLIYNKDMSCPRDADVSGDGRISGPDYAMIILNYNHVTGESGFTTDRDISCDGKLNVIEIVKIGFEWGTR